jgi:hypothetical protein
VGLHEADDVVDVVANGTPDLDVRDAPPDGSIVSQRRQRSPGYLGYCHFREVLNGLLHLIFTSFRIGFDSYIRFEIVAAPTSTAFALGCDLHY